MNGGDDIGRWPNLEPGSDELRPRGNSGLGVLWCEPVAAKSGEAASVLAPLYRRPPGDPSGCHPSNLYDRAADPSAGARG